MYIKKQEKKNVGNNIIFIQSGKQNKTKKKVIKLCRLYLEDHKFVLRGFYKATLRKFWSVAATCRRQDLSNNVPPETKSELSSSIEQARLV